MTVYVVEAGCYSDRYICGVYATVEAAMLAHPVPTVAVVRPGGWRRDPDPQDPTADQGREPRWDNGCNWDQLVVITPYAVDV